jgi:hypothetical protein
MEITLILQITALVLLVTACILKITSERRKHSKFLSDFDARHEARAVELNSFLAIIEQDKKDNLI